MKQILTFKEHILAHIKESTGDVIKAAQEDEMLELFLANLIHGKKHVMENSERVPEMDMVFSLCTGDTYGPLYRGTYRPVDVGPGQQIVFSRYESFSENESIAKRFTTVNTVMKATGSVGGFNYAECMKILLLRMKRRNPEIFDAIDGGSLLNVLEMEKEWIFNIGSVFSVENIKEEDGYKIIEGTIGLLSLP